MIQKLTELELNDKTVFLRVDFNVPIKDGKVGEPHRIRAFEEALRYIVGHDKVWLATGREITRHFIDDHFDDFVKASQPAGTA